jgi:hypothetical protein
MSLLAHVYPELLLQTVSALAAAISVLTAVLVYKMTKQINHQKEDAVLEWSKTAIDQLQTLVLLCEHGDSLLPVEAARDAFARIAISTSVLLEQGRLFFRNSKDKYGNEKELAYRGYRPVILDKLLVAHRIALECTSADVGRRKALGERAHQNREKFVSLLQSEVALARKAGEYASQAGERICSLSEPHPL